MPKPGTMITNLPGYDVGSGAIVLSWRGNIAKLFLQDQDKVVHLRIPKGMKVQGDEFERLNFAPSVVDPSVPSGIDNITGLPLYWGPRDPNYPSSLTDVSYRPQQWWNRMLGRWAKASASLVKSASPLSNEEVIEMEKTACQLNPQSKPGRVLHLELWTDEMEKDACLKKEILVQTAVEFLDEYEHLRTRSHPRFGRGWNVRIAEFLVFFLAEMELARDERACFLEFLQTIGIITEADRDEVKTLQSQMLTKVMREELPRIASVEKVAAYNVMAVAAAEEIANWLRGTFLSDAMTERDRDETIDKITTPAAIEQALINKFETIDKALLYFAKKSPVISKLEEKNLLGLLDDPGYINIISGLVSESKELAGATTRYNRIAAIAKRFGFVLLK